MISRKTQSRVLFGIIFLAIVTYGGIVVWFATHESDLGGARRSRPDR